MVTSSHVRLTANEQSQQGAIWNTKVSIFFILTKKIGNFQLLFTLFWQTSISRAKIVTFVCIILTDFHFTRKIVDIFYVLFQPVKVRNWELQVQFKVTGSTKDLHGDGFVIWYARDRMQGGPVFGSKDYFSGLAIVADTYSNHNGPHNVKFLSLNSLLFLLIFFLGFSITIHTCLLWSTTAVFIMIMTVMVHIPWSEAVKSNFAILLMIRIWTYATKMMSWQVL